MHIKQREMMMTIYWAYGDKAFANNIHEVKAYKTHNHRRFIQDIASNVIR